MNYYNKIKNLLVNNEIVKRVKDYSKNRSDLTTYYNVGKLLSEAGKHYGENIINEYSKRLTNEFGKGYGVTNLKRMRKFYYIIKKGAAMPHQLSWSHIIELLPISDVNCINYYIDISEHSNLSYRELREKIKTNEYERLDCKAKKKLIKKENTIATDLIKNPILIKNMHSYQVISEKILQKLILEDISSFLKELGKGFAFIANEYKIKLGNYYNYIDLLLFNIEYNCYVVVELKVTEYKAEYLGQVLKYINYIDQNIKQPNHDKTIGIIICREDNQLVLKYATDDRICNTTYQIFSLTSNAY